MAEVKPNQESEIADMHLNAIMDSDGIKVHAKSYDLYKRYRLGLDGSLSVQAVHAEIIRLQEMGLKVALEMNDSNFVLSVEAVQPIGDLNELAKFVRENVRD